MKEDETNWFSKWQDDLPSPEELMPMSQTLITPDLAMAFDIKNHSNSAVVLNHHVPQPPQPPISSAEFGGGDSGEMVSAAGSEEPARTLKRPRLVWTPQLHKRFVDAVAHLGIKNAVPKTIMQLMNVEGLTRENVASHLQKYRLYLKRMQGLGNGNGNGNGGSNGNGSGGSDPATDHLFASSPVPSHFLHQARGNSEHFLPYMPAAALQHPQMAMQHPQLQAVAAAATQYSRPVGHFGSVPTNAGFEHPFLSRQSQGVQRIGPAVPSNVPAWNYVDDLETENGNGDRKVLTLFPTADD